MIASSILTHRAARLLGLAAIIAAIAVLSSCAAVVVGPPTSEETQSVLTGKKVAVLFRLTVEMDAKPAAKDELMISVANIDRNEDPPLVTVTKSPSQEADDSGWIFFFVEPGTHYIQVLPNFMSALVNSSLYHMGSARYGYVDGGSYSPPPGMYYAPDQGRWILSGQRPPGFKELPGYWFHVSGGDKVVYIGSLRVSCVSGGLFGALSSCPDYQVADQTSNAREVTRTALPGLGRMSTRMLAPLGSVANPIARDSVFPMEVAAGGSTGLKESLFTGAKGAGYDTITAAGPLPLAQGAGIFNIISIMAQEASFASQDEAAREEAKKWQPCFNKLGQEIGRQPVGKLLVSNLRNALGTSGDAETIALSGASGISSSGGGSVFETENLAVRLSECVAPGSYCVEVQTRARLRDRISGDLIYDSVLVYNNEYPPGRAGKRRNRLYHVRTASTSVCRAMAAYCEHGGVEIVKTEISKGIRSIIEKIASDLGLTPREGPAKGS